jgi:peptidyl-prolyl cis-trans isomerase B (cyclophilin B)
MARTSDPNTNGSQFFIVYDDTQLPTEGGGYSIFGTVTKGLDVIKKIAEAGVEGGAGDGKPAQPVTIESVAIGQG